MLIDEARAAYLYARGWKNARVELPPGLPLVTSDRRRIMPVLVDPLPDVGRHSQGSLVISVNAVVQDAHVAVSVENLGWRIPADHATNLVRKFARAESVGWGRATVLDLGICREIVEARLGSERQALYGRPAHVQGAGDGVELWGGAGWVQRVCPADSACGWDQ